MLNKRYLSKDLAISNLSSGTIIKIIDVNNSNRNLATNFIYENLKLYIDKLFLCMDQANIFMVNLNDGAAFYNENLCDVIIEYEIMKHPD